MMNAEYKAQKLPIINIADIEINREEIFNPRSNIYLWGLYKEGTALCPLGIDEYPDMISYLDKESNNSYENRFYEIDIGNVTIKKIEH